MSEPDIVAVMAALGHVLRLRLWRMLVPCGEQGLPAGMIATRMSILPSSLSFHLRQMTQAGVLIQRRSSRQIIYAANLDIIHQLLETFAQDRRIEGMNRPDIRNGSGSGHSAHLVGEG